MKNGKTCQMSLVQFVVVAVCVCDLIIFKATEFDNPSHEFANIAIWEIKFALILLYAPLYSI